MENKNIKKFYQQSAKPFNYVPSDLVDAAPTIPPTMSGLMKINPDTGDIWVSAGNSFVTDWRLITGGGGGSSVTLKTNGIQNPTQTILDLQEGTGITLVDNGLGAISITASNVGPTVIMLPVDIVTSSGYKEIDSSVLSIPMQFGKSYSWRFVGSYDVSNTDLGTAWGMSSVDATSYGNISYYTMFTGTSGATTFLQQLYRSDFTTIPSATGSTGSNKGNIVIIEGILTNLKNDSATVSVACGISQQIPATLTIYAGATLTYYELP